MSLPSYSSLTLILLIAKSACDKTTPFEFILTNISVTVSIESDEPNSILPIEIFFIDCNLFILSLTILGSISNLFE